jgi:hypothetical protein
VQGGLVTHEGVKPRFFGGQTLKASAPRTRERVHARPVVRVQLAEKRVELTRGTCGEPSGEVRDGRA